MTKQKSSRRSFRAIEADIRRCLGEMENANNENAAALAYSRLKSDIEEYLERSASLRDEYYRTRNTVYRQAKDISELALDAVVGEAAPSASGQESSPSIVVSTPDVLHVENAPDFFFVQLSVGMVNIRHIAFLDTKASTLYLSGGIVRQLSESDLRLLSFTCKLYRR